MSDFDPITWSAFAQGMLAGASAVACLWTLWAHRARRRPSPEHPSMIVDVTPGRVVVGAQPPQHVRLLGCERRRSAPYDWEVEGPW